METRTEAANLLSRVGDDQVMMVLLLYQFMLILPGVVVARRCYCEGRVTIQHKDSRLRNASMDSITLDPRPREEAEVQDKPSCWARFWTTITGLLVVLRLRKRVAKAPKGQYNNPQGRPSQEPKLGDIMENPRIPIETAEHAAQRFYLRLLRLHARREQSRRKKETLIAYYSKGRRTCMQDVEVMV